MNQQSLHMLGKEINTEGPIRLFIYTAVNSLIILILTAKVKSSSPLSYCFNCSFRLTNMLLHFVRKPSMVSPVSEINVSTTHLSDHQKWCLVIFLNVNLAIQKTESFLYRWQRAHAIFNVTSFSDIRRHFRRYVDMLNNYGSLFQVTYGCCGNGPGPGTRYGPIHRLLQVWTEPGRTTQQVWGRNGIYEHFFLHAIIKIFSYFARYLSKYFLE